MYLCVFWNYYFIAFKLILINLQKMYLCVFWNYHFIAFKLILINLQKIVHSIPCPSLSRVSCPVITSNTTTISISLFPSDLEVPGQSYMTTVRRIIRGSKSILSIRYKCSILLISTELNWAFIIWQNKVSPWSMFI